MKNPLRILCFLLLIAGCPFSYGQMEEYNYKRELKGVEDQWYKIVLPNEIFSKTSQNLTDIRVFGLTANNDTIEAPYLLRSTIKEELASKDVAFKILNISENAKGYYFTLEIPTEEPINQIKLDFAQENFDWKITLEGSQDQKEWFQIVENYRILSIKNDQTDFQFTKVAFPSTKYRFFRLLIDSKDKPELRTASITKNEITDGEYRRYRVRKTNVKENRKTKQTEIDVELQLPVPLTHINMDILDTIDYYRPVIIKYLTDSINTQQGWKYNYRTLKSGTLNSIEKNGFQFSSTTAQKLKIFIDNYDNRPLEIGTIEVKGPIHEVIARFSDKATYFLTYGNKSANKPKYDIERFAGKIPKSLTPLDLGEELIIKKEEVLGTEPLFRNKTWLWIVMIAIIALLGWFSVKMMRNK